MFKRDTAKFKVFWLSHDVQIPSTLSSLEFRTNTRFEINNYN